MNAQYARQFFFPRLTPAFLVRLVLVIVASLFFFSQIFLPLRIQGHSMEPTYNNGGLALCWRLAYLFSSPQPGDVVAIRFAGNRVVLLKRVVALAGDTVSFRKGILWVNGRSVAEPYVRNRAPWQLPARVVHEGKLYVVGDNRGVPMAQHHFGQVEQTRIVGEVIW